jgi:protein involved in polysaccharide export with SLBB domain
MKILLKLLLMLSFCFSVEVEKISGSRYFTGDDGVIRIYVNIWGEVANPGRLLIEAGVDLPTVLSIAGGPSASANLKKIKIYRDSMNRDSIDRDDTMINEVNILDYVNSGDVEGFIEIRPNDTIIIPKKNSAFFMENINAVTTIMTLVNLYFTLEANQKDG